MIEIQKPTQLAWRRFLLTPEGKEGMLYLRERSPRIERGDQNAIIFGAGVVEGYRMAIDIIPDVIGADIKPSQDFENP